jgi:DNA-binding NarL/FixJ family response regulator
MERDRVGGVRATLKRRGLAVLVVGRNDLMRRGLSSIAERGGFRVVGECVTAGAAVGLLGTTAADLALCDVDSAEAVMDELAPLARACPLLVLGPDGDMATVRAVLRAGARGCVPRSSPADVLISEMHVAAHGETVVPRALAVELVSLIPPVAGNAPGSGSSPVGERLTAREREVLQLVARGWDNAHIGSALFISPRTVKNHIASILEKLNVENRVQAAVCAVRNDLADSGNGLADVDRHPQTAAVHHGS